MSAQRKGSIPWGLEEPAVIELDGPPTAYFEIPLDYFATPNGELEAEGHPEAARLVQNVVYQNFCVADLVRVQTILARVSQRLKEIGGGYLWWRHRPAYTTHVPPRMHLRLGTSPTLPADWWQRLERDVDNRFEGH